MDESTSTGVGTRVGRVPESAAEVDRAELVGVDVGVGVRLVAGAVVGERGIVVRVDVGVMALHRAMARAGIRAEPGRVARRRGRVRLEVRERRGDVALGGRGGGVDGRLLRG